MPNLLGNRSLTRQLTVASRAPTGRTATLRSLREVSETTSRTAARRVQGRSGRPKVARTAMITAEPEAVEAAIKVGPAVAAGARVEADRSASSVPAKMIHSIIRAGSP